MGSHSKRHPNCQIEVNRGGLQARDRSGNGEPRESDHRGAGKVTHLVTHLPSQGTEIFVNPAVLALPLRK